MVCVAHAKGNVSFWHQCIGHLHWKGIKTLPSMVIGMNLDAMHEEALDDFCEACLGGKQNHVLFSIQDIYRADKILNLIN